VYKVKNTLSVIQDYCSIVYRKVAIFEVVTDKNFHELFLQNDLADQEIPSKVLGTDTVKSYYCL